MKLCREMAVSLAASGWWRLCNSTEAFLFQAGEDLLCMPFSEYQRVAEESLGRPVWTHEFANPERLLEEFRGERRRPTMADILALIPRRFVWVAEGDS